MTTQRNVCLPMCPWFKYGYMDSLCTKSEDHSDSGETIIGDPCPFNIGFEVLSKEQWEKVGDMREVADLYATNHAAVDAFDDMEKERK